MDIPAELEWAHLVVSLGIPPSELLVLDQEALVLYEYQQGRKIGEMATQERRALAGGW